MSAYPILQVHVGVNEENSGGAESHIINEVTIYVPVRTFRSEAILRGTNDNALPRELSHELKFLVAERSSLRNE